MTLVFRNGLLTLLLVVAALLLLGYLATVVLLLPEGVPWAVLSLAPALAVGFGGLAWLRRSYRKTTVPSLFFFALFLFCLEGEGLRVGQALLSVGSFPFWYGVLLTKTVWAVRLFGLFSLLAASLYQMELPYQNYGNLVAAAIVAAALVVTGLPVQTTAPGPDLTYPIGDFTSLFVFFLAFLVVATANQVLAWWKDTQGQQPRRLLAWVLLLAGWVGTLTVSPFLALLAVPGVASLARLAREDSF